MSSRDDILRAVRQNKPEAMPLPEAGALMHLAGDLADRFAEAIRAVGAEVVERTGGDVDALVAERFPEARHVASSGVDVQAAVPLGDVDDPHELASLDVLVCRGVFGVAENGAVWLPESHMGHRAAPFLTQHLVIVLDPSEVVADMHAAYARLKVDEEGFGLFVAGPSKTADIEQSLVIGAHGPRSLTVVLVGGEGG